LAGDARDDELNSQEALALVEQLADLGCRDVTLSGGEPLLRPDWAEIASSLKVHGIRVCMFSNGWALDREVAHRAKSAGIEQIFISIDGLQATHDRLRGRIGSWKRAMEAINHLRDANIITGATTSINRWNIGELEQIHRQLVLSGVRRWQLLLGAKNGWKKRGFWLQPDDLLELIPQISRLQSESPLQFLIGDNMGYYGSVVGRLRSKTRTESNWSGCLAGCQILGIESNGNVKGCLTLPSQRHGCESWIEGNIRQRPLREIWSSTEAFAYNRKPDAAADLSGFCQTCEYAAICRAGCHWTAEHYADGNRENHYCYHRQLMHALDSATTKQKLSKAAAMFAVILGFQQIGGCICGVHILAPEHTVSESNQDHNKEVSAINGEDTAEQAREATANDARMVDQFEIPGDEIRDEHSEPEPTQEILSEQPDTGEQLAPDESIIDQGCEPHPCCLSRAIPPDPRCWGDGGPYPDDWFEWMKKNCCFPKD
jgi:radical SAM protein with 4Fe4S-binding SPASM domain